MLVWMNRLFDFFYMFGGGWYVLFLKRWESLEHELGCCLVSVGGWSLVCGRKEVGGRESQESGSISSRLWSNQAFSCWTEQLKHVRKKHFWINPPVVLPRVSGCTLCIQLVLWKSLFDTHPPCITTFSMHLLFLWLICISSASSLQKRTKKTCSFRELRAAQIGEQGSAATVRMGLFSAGLSRLDTHPHPTTRWVQPVCCTSSSSEF